jgi:DNA-binding SARP family transcriptional activator
MGFRRAGCVASGLLVAGVAILAMAGIAGGVQPEVFGVDQVSQSVQVPITNPADGASYPSVVLVTSARLDSKLPDGSDAPKGMLALSLQMSSNHASRQYGDPLWGDFFSNLTPLPGTAVVYVAQDGTHYPATMTSPVAPSDQGSNTDGLLDASYSFLVPATNRSGTLEIGPATTTGAEFTGFTGGDPTPLDVGGPVQVALSFPQTLTVVTPTTLAPTTTMTSNTAGPATQSTPGSSSGSSSLPIGGAALALIGLGIAGVMTRQRWLPLIRQGTKGAATSDQDDSEEGTHEQDFVPEEADPPSPDPAAISLEGDEPPPGVLKISVLGALRFEPSLGYLSDPARAFLCYLALHRERPIGIGEAQTALWPTSSTVKDITRATFHNYVTEARRVVGNEILPEAGRSAGYQLTNIEVDAERFSELERRARTADEAESIALRTEALSMLREYPFAAEVSSFFEWVRTEGIESRIVQQVSDVAYRTALDQMRLGDPAGAEASLRTALIVAPASMAIWGQLVDVIVGQGEEHRLEQLFDQASGILSEHEIEDLRTRGS